MTDTGRKSLIQKALQARDMAYAPYSHFKVGAAVLTGSGTIYGGCNVENNSYGASLCAERNAIGTAIAAGEKKIYALAVAGSSDTYTTPCGICWQVMTEFNIQEVFCVRTEDDYLVRTGEELLPCAFFEKSLL